MTEQCKRSYGRGFPAILTDSAGDPLPRHASVDTFHAIACENVETVDFFLDSSGDKYMEVLNCGVYASKEVPLTMQYCWQIGDDVVIKSSYTVTTSASDSDDTLPTAYAPGEFVPYGVKHFIRVTAGALDSGTYNVYAYAMIAQQ